MRERDLTNVPKPGDIIASKYKLEKMLGKGAAGVVFEATHELIGRRVAIKWLYPQLAHDDVVAQRFLREAKAANAVDHPAVVEIYDAGRHGDSLYLVMEHLKGEPLSSYIARGVSDPSDLVAVIMPALRGVAAAHERGVVHRDLKPDNIFLCAPRRGRPGGAKVLDFGISKLRQSETSGKLTSAGTYLGSPYYMAPEQIADSSTVDERADVYSIGVMLYEGLTGRVPYDADSLAGLFFKISNEAPELVSDTRTDVPEALERVIMKAMSPAPEDRFGSVRELARELEPFAGGAVFETLDEAIGEALGERPSSRRPPGAAVAAGTTSEVVELDAVPTQISTAGDRGDDVIEGRKTYESIATGAPAPSQEEPRDTDPPVSGRDTDPTKEPPSPPPPASRALAALRGSKVTEIEASPTKPMIKADEVDGAPDPLAGQTLRDIPPDQRPGIATAKTVELSRPQWEATAQVAARAPSRGGVPWVAVVGASVLIALLTVVLVLALR